MHVPQDAYPLPQPTKGSSVSAEGLTKAVNSKTQYSSNRHHVVQNWRGLGRAKQARVHHAGRLLVPSGQWIKHSLLYPQSAFLSLFQSVGSFLIDLGAAVISNRPAWQALSGGGCPLSGELRTQSPCSLLYLTAVAAVGIYCSETDNAFL